MIMAALGTKMKKNKLMRCSWTTEPKELSEVSFFSKEGVLEKTLKVERFIIHAWTICVVCGNKRRKQRVIFKFIVDRLLVHGPWSSSCLKSSELALSS